MNALVMTAAGELRNCMQSLAYWQWQAYGSLLRQPHPQGILSDALESTILISHHWCKANISLAVSCI